ncbi:MAG: VWA domain-containing protein, partial [Deltaproteobacteria bacterium]|nr:VWA domain-containing protein [Deltaproteobacteria bacterium]
MLGFFHSLARLTILTIGLVAAFALKAGATEVSPPTTVIAPSPPRVLPRPSSYQVEKLEIFIKIDGQMASFVHRTTIKNTGSGNLEMDYLVPLPTESAISGLTLIGDGQELPGKLYRREEAFEIYRQIVAQIKDPALMEYSGQGFYRARIFPIPANKSRTLELAGSYLLPKDQGLISLNFPVAGPLTQGQLLPEQEIRVTLAKAQDLASLYSPLAEVKIERFEAGATAVYQAKGLDPLNNFQLFARDGQEAVGAVILSHKPEPGDDGYFLFMAEPAINRDQQEPVLPKNVIFVLDTSGSMQGQKFKQAVEALKFVLERLNSIDSFNLIDFNSQTRAWREKPSIMTPENKAAALKYLDNLRAQGATNIEDALKKALAQKFEIPTYVLFLSDGEPTQGQTNELALTKIGQEANGSGARLFAFGVGERVNARLLDRLSGQAGGATVYVAEKENIEEKVSVFFSKLTSPVLTSPDLSISAQTNRLIPQKPPDIFQNGQVVVVGRYPKGGSTTFTLSGLIEKAAHKFVYQANLATGSNPEGEFIQLLWARRRVGEIIDLIDLAKNDQKVNLELAEELVALSKKYGILTPYTSFLALEKTDLAARETNVQTAAQNLRIIENVVGESANVQRELKQNFMASQDITAAPAPPEEMEKMRALDQAANKDQSALLPPRRLAGQTFFNKNGRLLAEDLTAEDIQNAIAIEAFSEEYFALAKSLPAESRV